MEQQIITISKINDEHFAINLDCVNDEHFALNLDCTIEELLNGISMLAKEANDFFKDKDYSEETINEILIKALTSRLNEETD